MFTAINNHNGETTKLELHDLEYWYDNSYDHTFIKNDNGRVIFLHIDDNQNVTYKYYRQRVRL